MGYVPIFQVLKLFQAVCFNDISSFQVPSPGPRHSQCEWFLHNIGPGPSPGDSQCEYTIKPIPFSIHAGFLFITITDIRAHLLTGKERFNCITYVIRDVGLRGFDQIRLPWTDNGRSKHVVLCSVFSWLLQLLQVTRMSNLLGSTNVYCCTELLH